MTTIAQQKDEQHYDNQYAMTQAMARNVSAWTEDSIRCYGVQTFHNDALWWRQPGGSGIYLGAATLDDQTPDEQLLSDLRTVQEAWGQQSFVIYECWDTRNLEPSGMSRAWQAIWYLRRPLADSPIPSAFEMPAGLSIEIVETAEQLAAFEYASILGFSDGKADMDAHETFSQHHIDTLDNPDMYYLNARLNGEVVASTIAHATEDMVGIYGISTLVPHRRRGYATALVHATLSLRPTLPTCVHPDPPSVPIYTGLGFVRAGAVQVWKHSAE